MLHSNLGYENHYYQNSFADLHAAFLAPRYFLSAKLGTSTVPLLVRLCRLSSGPILRYGTPWLRWDKVSVYFPRGG